MNNEDRDILNDLIDYNKERITKLEDKIFVINHEMAEIIGKVNILMWLLGGCALGIIGQILLQVLGG